MFDTPTLADPSIHMVLSSKRTGSNQILLLIILVNLNKQETNDQLW